MIVPPIPPDWTCEGPDESVGIFGEDFYHETCLPGANVPADVSVVGFRFIPRSWGMEIETISNVKCCCLSSFRIRETDVLYTYEESEAS